MGRAVAARLTGAGLPVVATSRTAASRDAVRGLEIRATPAEVAAADPVLVLTCLPSGVEVAAVATQLVAGLRAGRSLLLVDLSTTAPAEAAALHERLRAGGHRAIDAPVSGGPTGASTGTLSIMAGAVEADLCDAEPILAHLGTVVHCGPPGSGQVAKACNQLVVAGTLVAVAEALTLARRCGADPALVRAALSGGYAASRVLESQGERMLRGDFEGRGKAGLLAKDVGIIRRLAGETALGTPVLDAAGAIVDRLAARDPDIDHCAVITIIEEMVS